MHTMYMLLINANDRDRIKQILTLPVWWNRLRYLNLWHPVLSITRSFFHFVCPVLWSLNRKCALDIITLSGEIPRGYTKIIIVNGIYKYCKERVQLEDQKNTAPSKRQHLAYLIKSIRNSWINHEVSQCLLCMLIYCNSHGKYDNKMSL